MFYVHLTINSRCALFTSCRGLKPWLFFSILIFVFRVVFGFPWELFLKQSLSLEVLQLKFSVNISTQELCWCVVSCEKRRENMLYSMTYSSPFRESHWAVTFISASQLLIFIIYVRQEAWDRLKLGIFFLPCELGFMSWFPFRAKKRNLCVFSVVVLVCLFVFPVSRTLVSPMTSILKWT